ncbi:MAG: transcription termination factor Rho, partial [Planctomycetota bacterium]
MANSNNSNSRPSRGPRKLSSGRRHSNPSNLDPEVLEKIREIESDGEPLSIAETISREERFDPKFKGDKDQKVINVNELQKLTLDEVKKIAVSEFEMEIEDGENKRELIYRMLKESVKSKGIMFGEGTLQILPDGFGFLRSPDYQYLNCPDDIYVSPSQIRKFNLRNGAVICGQIRPPKENERYFALLRVNTVNGLEPSESAARTHFDELTPLHPDSRIIMEHDPKDVSTRVVDMVTPIGFGQRGLIVSPPRAGKTILMQRMAKATLANYPEAYVIMLLVDERPEEVTDMEREVKGDRCEVISSTFDEPASRHIQVAEMVLEKAKRLV